jgi:hypothetical protein
MRLAAKRRHPLTFHTPRRSPLPAPTKKTTVHVRHQHRTPELGVTECAHPERHYLCSGAFLGVLYILHWPHARARALQTLSPLVPRFTLILSLSLSRFVDGRPTAPPAQPHLPGQRR